MKKTLTDTNKSSKSIYFKQILCKHTSKKEKSKNYWNISIDPDGKKRFRHSIKEFKQFAINQDYIIKFINNKNTMKVLDVGCGIGYLLSKISSKHKKFGTEIDDTVLNIASKFGQIFIGDLKNINFNKNYFDLIVCHHVIEHVKKPEIMLTEIKKILKKNGTLIMSTPDFDSGCARRYNQKYRLLNDPTYFTFL